MNRRFRVACLVSVLLGVGILYLAFQSHQNRSDKGTSSSVTAAASHLSSEEIPKHTQIVSQSSLAPSNVPSPSSTFSSGLSPASPSAQRLSTATRPEYTNLPPETVLERLRTTFRAYQSMFGGNPVGTNPEITAALNGNNPKHAQFIREEYGMRINGKGELVDPWGTPYFFHQLSGTDMEIHSAGPDQIMWTPDDLVVK